MLEGLLTQLVDEFSLTPFDQRGSSFHVNIGENHLILKELESGFGIQSLMIEVPFLKEDLLTFLMEAHFLGQLTGDHVIGLDHEEKFLTLSRVISYEVDYIEFKNLIEDFMNYLHYWSKEISSIELKSKEGIL